MKNLKLKSILFSLMAITMVTVFLSSCEKETINSSNKNLKANLQEAKFSKDLTINSSDKSEVKLTVSTDDISLLELIGENSFSIEPIFENPIRPENEDDIALETENDELEAETLLMISIEDQILPEKAIGFKITFKENKEIVSRYNKTSKLFSSNIHKKIFTKNSAFISIKMHYFDDGILEGFRSLCSGPCPQTDFIFKRNDMGVGCKYEYWNFGFSDVTIIFFN